jgi:N-methylhydantoinase B
MPDILNGDLCAAIASVRIGARRFQDPAGRYGVAVLDRAVAVFMDQGEAITRRALAGLPHGTFELSEEQDDGRIFHVKITIGPDLFRVDPTRNPDQSPNPVNTSRDGVMRRRS